MKALSQACAVFPQASLNHLRSQARTVAQYRACRVLFEGRRWEPLDTIYPSMIRLEHLRCFYLHCMDMQFAYNVDNGVWHPVDDSRPIRAQRGAVIYFRPLFPSLYKLIMTELTDCIFMFIE